MTATVALAGAAGGVGTTRLTVECAATLARAGYDVAVLDADYATQGLAAYVDGQLGTDITKVVTEDRELEAAVADYPADTAGRLALAAARAPFERLARAKTAGAAERFEDRMAAASLSHDVVFVDTPPVAANQAVASVTAADRVAVVTADSRRGADALARTRGRLQDVGTAADAVLVNRAGEPAVVTDADAAVPATDRRRPADAPACLQPDETFAPAVAAAAEAAAGVSLDLEFPSGGRLDGLFDG
jgi:MinD-like ATPase involved in chromosome partitioning or flagellar assembly